MAEPEEFSGLSRAELFDVYRMALEQYRFEVQLNWERTKSYLVFSVAVLGVGTGLISLADSGPLTLLVVLVFGVGAGASLLGFRMIAIGRQYTRATMLKALLAADELGLTRPLRGVDDPLATHAIGTTSGLRDPKAALAAPTAWVEKPVGPDNVVYYVLVALRVLVGLHALAAIVAFYVGGCPATPFGCGP